MISVRLLRCARNDERGSAIIGLALCGLILVLGLGVGLVGAGVASYAAASNAADAAALAAAPVTFREFGAQRGPSGEAARFAASNGATLVRCICPIDPSWNPRTVEVVVVRRLALPILGSLRIMARSRATFEPAALLD